MYGVVFFVYTYRRAIFLSRYLPSFFNVVGCCGVLSVGGYAVQKNPCSLYHKEYLPKQSFVGTNIWIYVHTYNINESNTNVYGKYVCSVTYLRCAVIRLLFMSYVRFVYNILSIMYDEAEVIGNIVAEICFLKKEMRRGWVPTRTVGTYWNEFSLDLAQNRHLVLMCALNLRVCIGNMS